MTLNVSFNAETEMKLRDLAKATGKSIESLVRELVEEKVGAKPNELGSYDQAQQWRKWIDEMVALSKQNLPKGYVADDSRESIYSGRGE